MRQHSHVWGLAHALRAEGKEERALLELRAARATFERIGASDQEARAAQACGDFALAGQRPLHPPTGVHLPDAAVEGDYWSIGFDGQTARLRDSKGLQYLAHLLAEPGRELHVLNLVAAGRAGSDVPGDPPGSRLVADAGDAGELLDERANKRIAAGSQRSKKTLRKRGLWGTSTGLRKLMPNANVSYGSWPVRSDLVVAIDALGPRPNAPEAR